MNSMTVAVNTGKVIGQFSPAVYNSMEIIYGNTGYNLKYNLKYNSLSTI